MAQTPADRAGIRLDSAIARLGLARSRTHAARLIADGVVTVDGVPVRRASHRVGPDQALALTAADHYVSRAAHKLIAALDAFGIGVQGRFALDVGASTGGFTQVLLERGAGRVIALDVGHGQLAATIAAHPAVTVVEGCNARSLTAQTFAALAGSSEHPGLVVGDLSFISLRTVLPALVGAVGSGADYVLLVKPQFEVGRAGVRDGIVREPRLREEAVNDVLASAWELGLGTAGFLPSPLAGISGNREYLVWLSTAAGVDPTQWRDRVHSSAGFH